MAQWADRATKDLRTAAQNYVPDGHGPLVTWLMVSSGLFVFLFYWFLFSAATGHEEGRNPTQPLLSGTTVGLRGVRNDR